MTELEAYYNNLLACSAKIYTWLMLLPIVVAIWQRRYLYRPLLIFLYYCIVSFLLSGLEQIFIWVASEHYTFIEPFVVKYEIENTNFIQIFFVLKNYIFLGWFYYLLFSKRFSTVLKYLVAILSVASLINYFFIDGHKVIGVFNPVAEGVFRISIPAFYLWFLFKNLIHFPIKRNPYFWISFGLVSSNLITFLYYLISNSIYSSDFILFAKTGIAKNAFEITALILFSISFWFASYAKFIKPLRNTSTSINLPKS